MTLRQFFTALRIFVARVTPGECFDRIRAGNALLVDVRERKEWRNGFAESAALLPLSDLCRSRGDWRAFLATVGNRELILYCGAGVRSNLAARILEAKGFRAVNGGAFSEWAASGWPITKSRESKAE